MSTYANLKDRDKHNTEIPRFHDTGDSDICQFAQNITNFLPKVDASLPTYRGKTSDWIHKEILLDRIEPTDRTKFETQLLRQDIHVEDIDFPKLRRLLCIHFGPDNAEKLYLEKLFLDKQADTESLMPYYERKEDHFNKYLLYLENGTFTFDQFLTYFISGAQAREKVMIQDAQINGHISTNAKLFAWMDKRKELWNSMRPSDKSQSTNKKETKLNSHHIEESKTNSLLTSIATDISTIKNEQSTTVNSVKELQKTIDNTSTRLDKLESDIKNQGTNNYNSQRSDLNNMQLLREMAQMNQTNQMNMMESFLHNLPRQQGYHNDRNPYNRGRQLDDHVHPDRRRDKSRSPSPYQGRRDKHDNYRQ